MYRLFLWGVWLPGKLIHVCSICIFIYSIRWITGLAGSSSSWELRAGHTGPMVIALPRLQTATIKRCENASASVILNYRSLHVGPQRGKDDSREYVRGGGLHGG